MNAGKKSAQPHQNKAHLWIIYHCVQVLHLTFWPVPLLLTFSLLSHRVSWGIFAFKHIPNTNAQDNRQESQYVCFATSRLPFSQDRIISPHIQPEVVVICYFFCSFPTPSTFSLSLSLSLTFVSYSFPMCLPPCGSQLDYCLTALQTE